MGVRPAPATQESCRWPTALGPSGDPGTRLWECGGDRQGEGGGLPRQNAASMPGHRDLGRGGLGGGAVWAGWCRRHSWIEWVWLGSDIPTRAGAVLFSLGLAVVRGSGA